MVVLIDLIIEFAPGFGDVLTLLTIIGAGLAIALSEVLMGFAGWIRITFATSYKQGDRVEINGIRGDVIDVRTLRTTMMEIGDSVDADQSTGIPRAYP